jgi:hypothetical protein
MWRSRSENGRQLPCYFLKFTRRNCSTAPLSRTQRSTTFPDRLGLKRGRDNRPIRTGIVPFKPLIRPCRIQSELRCEVVSWLAEFPVALRLGAYAMMQLVSHGLTGVREVFARPSVLRWGGRNFRGRLASG